MSAETSSFEESTPDEIAVTAPRYDVAVIGAGFAGVLMGIRLKQAGITSFVIYEKGAGVGGTWRDNTYPGVACDVPSQHYCYSFEPTAEWSHRFSPGDEIRQYIEAIVDKYGLRPHLRTRCPVQGLAWDGRRWRVRLPEHETALADVVVSATGVLHHPAWPKIEGLDRFQGPKIHTARWRHDVPLEGKRVGVIGTATTAAQVVPALAEGVERMAVFQRTPNWVVPMPNHRYSGVERWFLRKMPWLLKLAHRANFFVLSKLYGEALVGHAPIFARLIRLSCQLNLLTVRDKALRARLTPSYTTGCKRLVFSNTYYKALQRENVDLITDPIQRVNEGGVVTEGGQHIPLDALILATGFKVDAFMRPMEVIGSRGRTIDEVWGDKPVAYRSVAVPHMPNLFTLIGPHSPIATQSVVEVAEWQSTYILRCIEIIRGQRVALSPTEEATARHQRVLEEGARRTVWAAGCKSWFLGKDGLPALYTLPPLRHRAELREPVDLTDFDVEPLSA